jgi:hypothetical protein
MMVAMESADPVLCVTRLTGSPFRKL